MADSVRYCILTTVPEGSVQLHIVRVSEGPRGETLHSPAFLSNFNTLPACMAYCAETYAERGESISWEHDRERGRYLTSPPLDVHFEVAS